MKILLFGVSCVGKSTVGQILAQKLDYKFYDLDDEIVKCLKMSLEKFVSSGNLHWRDKQRSNVIKEIVKKDEDMVFALSPISYYENFKKWVNADGIVLIELYDSAENIFSRLVFSDENDNIYVDDEYKNKRRNYYLRDINSDLEWYGQVNKKIGVKNRIFVNNDKPEVVADRIMEIIDKNCNLN